MKSYITYKNQEQGFKNVSETIKMMEKIAASSVHFLKQEVFTLNTYVNEIEKALIRLSVFYKKKSHPLLRKTSAERKMIIILTGDNGLVGNLWHETINTFLKKRKQYQAVVVIGVKGKNYLKEENIIITKSFDHIYGLSQEEEIKHIIDYVFDEFEKKAFSQVDVLYPQFISLAEQRPKFTSFLPFEFGLLKVNDDNSKKVADSRKEKQEELITKIETTKEKESNVGLPIFEPSKQRIFGKLLQKYIGSFFYKIVMETRLSELSARTVATEHATEKTKELIQKLRLNYTKERRRIITQRQLESFAAHIT